MKGLLVAFAAGAFLGFLTQTSFPMAVQVGELSFAGLIPGSIDASQTPYQAASGLAREGRAQKKGRIRGPTRAPKSGTTFGLSDLSAFGVRYLPNKLAYPLSELPGISQVISPGNRNTLSMAAVLLNINNEESGGFLSEASRVIAPLQGLDRMTVCGAATGACEQVSLAQPTSEVPEPDTLILLGIGLLTFSVLFRRRGNGPK